MIDSKSTGALPDRPNVSAIAEAYRAGHLNWDTDEEDREEAIVQNQRPLSGASQTEDKVQMDPRDPDEGLNQSPEMVAQVADATQKSGESRTSDDPLPFNDRVGSILITVDKSDKVAKMDHQEASSRPSLSIISAFAQAAHTGNEILFDHKSWPLPVCNLAQYISYRGMYRQL